MKMELMTYGDTRSAHKRERAVDRERERARQTVRSRDVAPPDDRVDHHGRVGELLQRCLAQPAKKQP